jgi:CubicO group peptidase (beta-lactamase class C family)
MAALAAAKPAAPPGAQWAYTDAEFDVLGAVIEAASGETYVDYVGDHILTPLGLTHASLFPSPGGRGGGLRPHLNYGLVLPAPDDPYDLAFAPCEGLVTDVRDLTLWLQATLNKDPRLLTTASYTGMLEPHAKAEDGSAGLGWQLPAAGGGGVAQHSGYFFGWRALVYAHPDQRRGVVVLANADDVPLWEIAHVAESILDGEDYAPPRSPQPFYLAVWGALALGLAAAAGAGARLFLRRRSRQRMS